MIAAMNRVKAQLSRHAEATLRSGSRRSVSMSRLGAGNDSNPKFSPTGSSDASHVIDRASLEISSLRLMLDRIEFESDVGLTSRDAGFAPFACARDRVTTESAAGDPRPRRKTFSTWFGWLEAGGLADHECTKADERTALFVPMGDAIATHARCGGLVVRRIGTARFGVRDPHRHRATKLRFISLPKRSAPTTTGRLQKGGQLGSPGILVLTKLDKDLAAFGVGGPQGWPSDSRPVAFLRSDPSSESAVATVTSVG